jgi:16S rRNA processing protein RimM
VNVRRASAPKAEAAEAAETAEDDDVHEVGRIVDAWGVKGWVKVQPHADDPQALLRARRWLLQPPEGPLGAPLPGGSLPPFIAIEQARRHGEFVVALPEGHADRDAAERLRGARVLVGRSAFPRPARDEYYWVDLIGLDVVNREGVVLGTVAGLLDNGAQAVLRVQPQPAAASDPTPAEASAAERMIPFVSAYVDDVDLEARCIRVDWGLDY